MLEYRIESLPIIDNKEPLLLDYDSLGVFKDKVVFHADLEKLLENWTVPVGQGYLAEFDNTYNEAAFSPGFRSELYKTAKNSIGLPMPRVCYSPLKKSIEFENGRHRTRFLQYLGAKDIYILIPDTSEQFEWFQENCQFES